MGDEFDGCECVWSHELAMQRLLNFIRQNQNSCTDTECMDVSGRLLQNPSTPAGNEDGSFTMMTTMLMILAVIMYCIRPQSIMKFNNSKGRIQGNPMMMVHHHHRRRQHRPQSIKESFDHNFSPIQGTFQNLFLVN